MDEGRWSPTSKTQYNLIDAVSRCTTQLRPNFADAWSNLAGAYMRKGRLSEVAQCCRQALALNPRLVDAHSNLGNKMKAQGLVHEALHIQPTFAVAWSNLSSLFVDPGDLNMELQYYKEAVKLKQILTDVYLNIGNVYKLSRNFSTSPAKQQTVLLELPEFWTFSAAYLGLDLGVLSWIFTCRFSVVYWNNLSCILG